MYWLVLTEIHQKLDEETRQIQELEELEDTLQVSTWQTCRSSNQQRTLGLSVSYYRFVPVDVLYMKTQKCECRLRILPVTVPVTIGNLYTRTTRLATISLCTADDSAAKATRLVCSSNRRLSRRHGWTCTTYLGASDGKLHIFSHDDEPRVAFYIEEIVPGPLCRESPRKPCSTTRTTWRKW